MHVCNVLVVKRDCQMSAQEPTVQVQKCSVTVVGHLPACPAFSAALRISCASDVLQIVFIPSFWFGRILKNFITNFYRVHIVSSL